MTGRAYVHEGSAETSLAEIRYEMSELLNKQVYAQKESLKKLPGVHTISCKLTKKYTMKVQSIKEKMTGA